MLTQENPNEPYLPKEIRTDSAAERPVFAPISPAGKRIAPPITWPIIIAQIPWTSPKGASKAPVIISAIDTAAPNHNNI